MITDIIKMFSFLKVFTPLPSRQTVNCLVLMLYQFGRHIANVTKGYKVLAKCKRGTQLL